MSNRFHSKFHRQNHHTYTSPTNPDAGHDPIASPEQPFYGDFILVGALSCVAPASAVAGYFYSKNTALCAIANQRGQYIYSYGNVGLEVYSSQSTAITAFAPYYGANIRSNVFGINVYGGQYGINTSSLVYGISSYAGSVAGSFYSPIRALSANGGQYGADIYSPNYGVNSYGGNAAGKFSSPIVALSAYGGQYGLNVYSPLTAIKSYGGQVAASLQSPVVSLSTGGGGYNRFDGRVGIYRTPQSSYPTSPNIVLDVNGNSYFDGSLTITGDLSTFGNLSYLDTIVYTTSSLRVINHTASAAGTFIQYGTDYPTLVCYDGDESLTVPTFTVLNKQIGINVSSPTNTFTVNSPVTITDLTVGAQYAIALNNNGGTNGDLAFGSSSTNSYIQSFNSKPLLLNSIGSNNIILAAIGGNVGIGTSTPSTKLQVNGAITLNAQDMAFNQLQAKNTSGVYINFPAVGNSGITDWALLRQIGDIGTGTLPSVNGNFHMALDLFDDPNSALGGQQFSIRNVSFEGTDPDIITTRFKIDGEGNVGINTDTPNSTLTVNGSISSTGSSTITVNSTLPALLVQQYGTGSAFRVDDTVNDTTPFVIDSSGKIGVGTTTPNALLTVKGSLSASDASTITVNSTSPALLVQQYGNGTAFRVDDTVNDTTPFIVTTTGSVGVGTTTPNVQLTVNGQISGNNIATFNKLSIKDSSTTSNATMGTATLVTGASALVSTSAVATNSRIFLTIQSPSGTVGSLYVSTRTASSSFTVFSTNASDRSTFAWFIVQPS